MGTGYLLDTNAVIDFCAKKLPENAHERLAAIIDTAPQISIINKIELLGFSKVPDQIVAFTQYAVIINLDEYIVKKTIDLRKKHKIKLPDAVIAATAIVFNLTLITHNLNDFRNMKVLKVLDSYLLNSDNI